MTRSPNAVALDLARRADLTRGTALRGATVGWPALDGALPGGLPRGRVTEWAGPRSAGKTAALRWLVGSVRSAGAGAAYVDATGTLAPVPWVPESEGRPPFWVVRPPGPAEALAAAEELLRSGAFGLVVAEGAEWPRPLTVRLQRLARVADAAVVGVVERAGRVPLAALRVEFRVASPGRRRIHIRGYGPSHDLVYVQSLPYRLPEDTGLPDRRAPAG